MEPDQPTPPTPVATPPEAAPVPELVADPGQPPADAGAWTHDQWIAWLKATDAQLAAGGATTETGPATPMGRVTHSAGGQVLGTAMLGLTAAMFGRQDDEMVIVAEASGQPGEDEPFAVHLDPDHPERSTVVFRPPPATGDG
jgi:hypothetical protein